MNHRYLSRQEIRRRVEVLEVLVALIFIGLSIWGLVNFKFLEIKINSEVQTSSIFFLIVITGLMELVPQIFYPGAPMAVAIATGFNPHLSIIFSTVGSILGSILGFWIGKKWGFGFIQILFEKNSVEKIVNFTKKYGNIFVMFAALTPLPYLPVVFGSLSMSKKDFFLWGIIPRTIGLFIWGYAIYFGFF